MKIVFKGFFFHVKLVYNNICLEKGYGFFLQDVQISK